MAKDGKRRSRGAGAVMRNASGYYVFQRKEGDKRVTVSLRTRNKREALEAAKKYSTATAGTDEAAFLSHVSLARSRARRRIVPLDRAWSYFLDTKPTAGEGTLGNYSRALADFITWLYDRNAKTADLSEVDESAVGDYLQSLWAGGISANTYHYRRNGLGLVFRKLLGDAAAAPWYAQDNRERAGEHARESHKPLTAAHALALVQLLDVPTVELPNRDEARVLFKLLLFTGARMKDAVLLHWSDVDLPAGAIRYIPHKTGRKGERAEVPILPPLREELATLYANRDRKAEYVFPALAALFTRNPDGVHKPMVKLLQTVTGEGANHNTAAGQRLRHRDAYGLHSLRTTFATQAAAAGVKPAHLALMLGDRMSTVDKFYVKVGLGQDAVTGFRELPAMTGGTAEPDRRRLHELVDALPLAKVRELLQAVEGKT